MQALLEAENATALLMRGTEGEAYVSPRRRPRLLGVSGGISSELFPQEEFADVSTADEPCTAPENALLIRQMLAGKIAIPQAILDQVEAIKTLALS